MIKQPTSLGCFLCGKNNPKGLHVFWVEDRENQEIYTETVISEDYRSYPGIVHGGIVASLLDETSGRAVFLNKETGYEDLMVTLKMEVIYKQITPTNTPLKVVGKILKPGKTRAQVYAEIRLPDGSVSASCTALVMKPPQKITSTWGEEEDEWKNTSPEK
ncbi:Thioesterase superfamily protein [Parelusimicrobium proximum]|uniref:PaaI family thioesterase n=1 Tax=Parelusimicrobium proximum TaxID=3228953 RepID=UPI003D16E021